MPPETIDLNVPVAVYLVAVARDGDADGEGDATATTSSFPQLLEPICVLAHPNSSGTRPY